MTPAERELLMTVAEVMKYNSELFSTPMRRRISDLLDKISIERTNGHQEQPRTV
jgi:hypothetical protein